MFAQGGTFFISIFQESCNSSEEVIGSFMTTETKKLNWHLYTVFAVVIVFVVIDFFIWINDRVATLKLKLLEWTLLKYYKNIVEVEKCFVCVSLRKATSIRKKIFGVFLVLFFFFFSLFTYISIDTNWCYIVFSYRKAYWRQLINSDMYVLLKLDLR